MESASLEVFTFDKNITDYSLSSLLGLSVQIILSIFTILIIGFKIAGIHLLELLQGNIHFHGDPSVFYLGIFLISATMLLVVQHHFSASEEDN